MCPGTWQAQYELTEDTVPQSMRKLLKALNRIEKKGQEGKDQSGRLQQDKDGLFPRVV